MASGDSPITPERVSDGSSLAGTTSSFPAIKRSGTSVAFRLADDSADAPITASTINGAAIDNTAWSTYTPTITTGTGSITTLGTVGGRYKQIGKTVFVKVKVGITTNGTGGGSVQATLPVTRNQGKPIA
jgi:hypothetical protein